PYAKSGIRAAIPECFLVPCRFFFNKSRSRLKLTFKQTTSRHNVATNGIRLPPPLAIRPPIPAGGIHGAQQKGFANAFESRSIDLDASLCFGHYFGRRKFPGAGAAICATLGLHG